MARVIPFRGLRYNPTEVSNPSSVLAPPYDIIPAERKEQLYRQSPHNIVQVDFGKDLPGDSETVNRYSRARNLLTAWQEAGVLIRDRDPGFYCYEVAYEMNGTPLRFRGLMGLVQIEPFEAGVVLPHEETHSKPKADRLNLIRATRANVSPIFSLYSSPRKITSKILEATASGEPPVLEGDDGVGGVHRLWRFEGEQELKAITDEFSDLQIFIADGHHRYETSLAYRQEAGDSAAGYVLMFLANMEEPGLTALPTHRTVPEAPKDYLARLKNRFTLEATEMGPGKTGFLEKMAACSGHCFGLYTGQGKGYLLKVDDGVYTGTTGPLGRLDVTLLHRLLLEEVLETRDFRYVMNPEAAMGMVDNDESAVAFFLNPTSLHELRDVARDGKRMPPKSTYFFPKLMTGMVLHLLDD